MARQRKAAVVHCALCAHAIDEANEILGLMLRHWNTIASALREGEVYVPLLLEDAAACACVTT